MPGHEMQRIVDIPGVRGAAIIGADMKPLSSIDRNVFPEGTEALLADIIAGSEEETGGARQINLAFQKGKIVVKTFSAGFIAVRCDLSLNVQVLNLSLARAVKKAGELAQNSFAAEDSGEDMAAGPAARPHLYVEVLEKTGGTFWESMTESAAMTRFVAAAIASACGTGHFRKVRLSTAGGTKKIVPVRLVQEPKPGMLEGKIVLTLAVAEALGVKRGDEILAEPAIGDGVFGWEGI